MKTEQVIPKVETWRFQDILSQPADNLTFHIPDSHESAPVVFSFKIRRAIFGNVRDF